MNSITPLAAAPIPLTPLPADTPAATPSAPPLAAKTITLPNKPLTHYLTTDPTRAAKSCDRKATFWNVAAKTSFIAFTVLSLLVGLIALTGPIGPGATSMVILGAWVLSLIPCSFRSRFQEWSDQAHNQAAIEHGTADILKEMSEWKKEEIEIFFTTYKLSLDSLPLERLAKLSPNEPLLALKPLIARFEYFKRIAAEQLAQAQHLMDEKLKNADLQLQVIKQGFMKLETEVLPTALRAAMTLQFLSQPTQEQDLTQVGRFDVFSPGDRFVRREVMKNDDYFVPTQGPALQWKEAVQLTRDENYAALRQKLFA